MNPEPNLPQDGGPNPGPGGDPDTRLLATYGWLSWHEARSLLDGADAVWLAPSAITRRSRGVPWPGELPVTTRIHAWHEAAAYQWRLIPRPARGTVLVTCLSHVDAPLLVAPGTGRAPETRRVTVTRVPGSEWDRTWIQESAAVMFLRPARTRTQGAER